MNNRKTTVSPQPRENGGAERQKMPQKPRPQPGNPRMAPGQKPPQKLQNNRRKKRNLFFLPLILALLAVSLFLFATLTQARRNQAGLRYQLESVLESLFAITAPASEAPLQPLPPTLPSYAERTDDTVELGDEIESRYAILICLEDNTIVAEKNGDERIYPASMTKVMTLLCAVEALTEDQLDDTFTMTYEIINPLVEQQASRTGFMVGEVIPVRDLLYGAILPSGADATEALAQYIDGSEEEFVKRMNRKAEEMKLTGTHFENASGLHNRNHYSTPHEMALIMEAAMQNDLCRQVLTAKQYTTAHTLKNPEGLKLYSDTFNRMYGDEPDGAEVIAGKTGYTDQARHCLVSYAVSDSGRNYIFVSADGEDSKYTPIRDCIKVYSLYTQ